MGYALAIFMLSLFVAFLSPRFDPMPENINSEDLGGFQLPTSNEDEFRPFIRRLPEFSFWKRGIRGVLIVTFLTLFRFLDFPVFYPILLFYFFLLCFVSLKRQVAHMISHKYVPFTWGKKKYGDNPVVTKVQS